MGVGGLTISAIPTINAYLEAILTIDAFKPFFNNGYSLDEIKAKL